MSIIDKSIEIFSPRLALRRAQARIALEHVRKYDVASKGSKRNKNWNVSDLSADADLLGSLSVIRARSRDLYKNSPISKRIADIIVGDVVGPGVVVEFENSSFDDLFTDFAESTEIDVEGAKDFYDMQSLAIETIVHSGEILVKRVVDPKYKYGVKFQLLDPDYVDHNKNETYQDNSRTIQGVKFDENGVVLGYWIFDEHPGGIAIIPKSFTSVFRPVGEYFLIFDKTVRASAARGIVHTVSVLQKIKDVSDTFDAEVVRRKIATCMVGVIVDPNGQASDDSDDDDNEMKFKPGSWSRLGPGQDVRFNTPPQVSDFSPFIQDQLRLIGMGAGVTYEALSLNLSTVNFSSARIGRIAIIPKIKRWQNHILINQFCKFIVDEFKKIQIIKNPKLPESKVSFTPPAPLQVDPITENNADKSAIRNGFKSLSKALRERGLDPKKALKEISQDQKLLDLYGLTLDTDPRKVSLAGNQNPTDEVQNV